MAFSDSTPGRIAAEYVGWNCADVLAVLFLALRTIEWMTSSWVCAGGRCATISLFEPLCALSTLTIAAIHRIAYLGVISEGVPTGRAAPATIVSCVALSILASIGLRYITR